MDKDFADFTLEDLFAAPDSSGADYLMKLNIPFVDNLFTISIAFMTLALADVNAADDVWS